MRKWLETNGWGRWFSRALTVMAAGVLSFTMVAGSTGCETTAGAGRDVEAVGEGIQEGAERTDPGHPEQW